MVDVKQVLESDEPSSLIDQLGDALLELNAHNDTSEDQVQWEEIEEHFRNLETTLRKNFEELEAKEKKFTKQEVETCASLAEREASQAKAIADEWKPKLANAGTDAANGISLEAEAFLQLLATFSIASEFDKDEICKFVLAVAHRRQTPELCRFLGLTHKIPGLVESMVSGGKQIDPNVEDGEACRKKLRLSGDQSAISTLPSSLSLLRVTVSSGRSEVVKLIFDADELTSVINSTDEDDRRLICPSLCYQ
ncbi:hypothetical protein ACFX2G_025845 [Malus domestica]